MRAFVDGDMDCSQTNMVSLLAQAWLLYVFWYLWQWNAILHLYSSQALLPWAKAVILPGTYVAGKSES